MLEKLTYINHMNESMEFGNRGLYANYSELRNYAWNYDVQLGRIVGFQGEVTEKTLPVVILCDSEDMGISMKNSLLEIPEKDILSKKAGKLYIGDYYLRCYIIGGKRENYLEDKRYLQTTLTIVTDYPFWIYEKVYNFSQSQITSTDNKKYTYKYAYRYANGLSSMDIINDHYTECNFLMHIYGPVTKPLVVIGGHQYFMNIVLEEGEYLEIDSITETIVKVMVSGIRINSFHYRDKKNSIFRKIQTGRQIVSWSGKFDFDVTLYQERSEPKW